MIEADIALATSFHSSMSPIWFQRRRYESPIQSIPQDEMAIIAIYRMATAMFILKEQGCLMVLDGFWSVFDGCFMVFDGFLMVFDSCWWFLFWLFDAQKLGIYTNLIRPLWAGATPGPSSAGPQKMRHRNIDIIGKTMENHHFNGKTKKKNDVQWENYGKSQFSMG